MKTLVLPHLTAWTWTGNEQNTDIFKKIKIKWLESGI